MSGAQEWQEVGDRVFVRRHRSLDLNVGLVVGDGACLVIDTRSSEVEGQELAAAVRQVTPAPWLVVDTHAHYDHCFGNAAFRPAPIWGHRRCAEVLAEYGETARQLVVAFYRKHGEAEIADQVAAARIDPPDQLLDIQADLDVGGRTVTLRYLGRGHTDSDLAVVVPDAGVLFAGDLIEEGAPPAFLDSFPLEWPSTAAGLLALAAGPVVPGHGAVVDADYVRAQQADLARIAEVARAAYAAGQPVAAAVAELPVPDPYATEALERAYRQLRGDPAYDPPAELLRKAGLPADPAPDPAAAAAPAARAEPAPAEPAPADPATAGST
jgi:glyoxylase-like metal-dependent hydrolase (beta-lactamase superfamily II)